jgi:hypothetical protein
MNRIVLSPEQLDAAFAQPEPVGPARLPCPRCESSDHLTTSSEVEGAGYGYLTYCGNCYDVDCAGDPWPHFQATTEQGWGMTRTASCEAWNNAVETRDGR